MLTSAQQPAERRTAIVTGAASGLGRAIARRLARDGWRIALCDVNLAGAKETLALVEAAGGAGQVEPLDVAEVAQWESLRDRLQAEWPRLDLLVNNAGVSCAGEVGQFALADWRWIVDVNLFGAVHGCHTLVDWLKQNPRGGHIVNIASVAAIASAPAMAAYNVTKAGIVSLSETLFAELRYDNVGVTCVCPGFFRTNLLETGRFLTVRQREAAAGYMLRARMSADDVADRIVRAIRHKRLYLITPRRARLLWRLKRAFPLTLLKLVASLYHRQHVLEAQKDSGSKVVE